MKDKPSRNPLDRWQHIPPVPVVSDHNGGPTRLELRQLRYFVTLAEELHFGRAAAREHIVQSALSQQVQRLERALGVALVERSTRQVRLTEAGRRFLVEAYQILGHVDRAIEIARQTARSTPALRIGLTDESYPTMRPILAAVQEQYPDLEIHQIHAGVPEQLWLMASGRLDVGIGLTPVTTSETMSEIASELIRLERIGVVLPARHHLAAVDSVPVAKLVDEPLLLADQQRAPEYNELITELCQSAGFDPEVHRGTVQTLQAALDLVKQGRCVLLAPASCIPAADDVAWRPLESPSGCFQWRLFWRVEKVRRPPVSALIRCARDVSKMHGWLNQPRLITSADQAYSTW